LDSSASGIAKTKEGFRHVAGEINVDNAQWALDNANEALVAAINATILAIEQTGKALMDSISHVDMKVY